MRTFAYWPGRSRLPGFGKTARASTVPLVTSTCRSRAAARLRLTVGVRLLEGGARVRHVGLRVLYRGASGRHRRDVSEVVLDGVVELLLANRPALGQRCVATHVQLRPTLVGLAPLHLRLVLGDLGECLLDLSLTRADLRLG